MQAKYGKFNCAHYLVNSHATHSTSKLSDLVIKSLLFTRIVEWYSQRIQNCDQGIQITFRTHLTIGEALNQKN